MVLGQNQNPNLGEIVGENPEKSDRGPPHPRLGEPSPTCRGKEATPEGLSGVTQHARQLSAQVYCTYFSPGAEGGGVVVSAPLQ